MKIELLYIDGCPHVQATLNRLNMVLQDNGISGTISEIPVADARAATELRFLGSPTVRMNGVDIEPSACQRTDFGIMCRTYDGSGIPSEVLIRNAISEAQDNWTALDRRYVLPRR